MSCLRKLHLTNVTFAKYSLVISWGNALYLPNVDLGCHMFALHSLARKTKCVTKHAACLEHAERHTQLLCRHCLSFRRLWQKYILEYVHTLLLNVVFLPVSLRGFRFWMNPPGWSHMENVWSNVLCLCTHCIVLCIWLKPTQRECHGPVCSITFLGFIECHY